MKFLKLQLGVLSMLLLFPVLAFCQAASPSPVAPTGSGWLLSLASSHPSIMSVLVFIGGARVFLKPAFAALHTFFQGAGLVAYDQKETAIEQSKAMKVVFFILDYVASIKAPVAIAGQSPQQPPAA